MNFSNLVQSIQQTHNALQQQATVAINRSLTIRNWLIGYYIVEFEQKKVKTKPLMVKNYLPFSLKNFKNKKFPILTSES